MAAGLGAKYTLLANLRQVITRRPVSGEHTSQSSRTIYIPRPKASEHRPICKHPQATNTETNRRLFENSTSTAQHPCLHEPALCDSSSSSFSLLNMIGGQIMFRSLLKFVLPEMAITPRVMNASSRSVPHAATTCQTRMRSRNQTMVCPEWRCTVGSLSSYRLCQVQKSGMPGDFHKPPTVCSCSGSMPGSCIVPLFIRQDVGISPSGMVLCSWVALTFQSVLCRVISMLEKRSASPDSSYF